MTLRLCFLYKSKQSLAALQHIPPGRLEIVRVPRVGYIAGAVGKVQQEVHLACVISAADALHIAEVRLIHADQEVVLVVVPIGQLPGAVPIAAYPMLG